MSVRSFWLSERRIRLPSWRAVVLTLLLGILGLWLFCAKIHGFLGETHEVAGAEILVVEGWVGDHVIKYAADVYAEGRYKTIYVSGIPVPRGRYSNGILTTDEIVVRSLKALGVPENQIHAAPVTEEIAGNRTLQMAQKLREALGHPGDFDILTDGIHSYRSKWTYQKVFPEREVGVISLPTKEYDPDRWWAYSAGVKKVMVELISVIYQRMRGFS